MTQSLTQLAESYYDSIEGIEEIVRRTKEQIRSAKEEQNTWLLKQLERKLVVCYEEIRDMKTVIHTLKSYNEYNKSEYTEAAG